jgi:general stress protein 26
VIHENETINAAIFGHHKNGEGLLEYSEGILVATNLRIIYLDHRPGFTTMDEIAYDVISGVNITEAGVGSSLALFTKIGNYTISFARRKSVERFADYVEHMRVDTQQPSSVIADPDLNIPLGALTFLETHDTAVLSTIERSGSVSGAVVYYTLLNDAIYIITKESTRKARNIFSNPQVALTMYDAAELQELQIQAVAQVEIDAELKEKVFKAIVHLRTYNKGEDSPPVTKIQLGAFVIFKILPISYTFSDFG